MTRRRAGRDALHWTWCLIIAPLVLLVLLSIATTTIHR